MHKEELEFSDGFMGAWGPGEYGRSGGWGLRGPIESFVYIPNLENPACLHTTPASMSSQPLSQIVPQASFTHNSTLPAIKLGPFTRRTAPKLQNTAGNKIM